MFITIALLAGCGGGSEEIKETQGNRPSQPNPPKVVRQDPPISYFERGHRIQIVKKFEFRWSSDKFRGLEFHYGTKLGANEKLGDGRGCVVLQPKSITEMGPIVVQPVSNVSPIKRDVLEDEVPDDFYFYGVKADLSVVASVYLYCYRHESLGPVTLDDFRQHFAGYIEFN